MPPKPSSDPHWTCPLLALFTLLGSPCLCTLAFHILVTPLTSWCPVGRGASPPTTALTPQPILRKPATQNPSATPRHPSQVHACYPSWTLLIAQPISLSAPSRSAQDPLGLHPGR